MSIKLTLAAGSLALATLLATVAGANAADAYATGNVNVRSGPGTYYGVVDTLQRGEQVDVQYCRDSWCYVEKRGPDGWVSASYLDRDRPRPPRPQRPDWNDDDYYGDEPQPGYPGWNRPQRPHYPNYGHQQQNSRVCFNGPNGYFCFSN